MAGRSVADLRSQSVDSKRASQHKQKWSRGEAWGPGQPSSAHARPAKAAPREKRSKKELGLAAARITINSEIDDGDCLTDSDGVVDDVASWEPELDVGVEYSFDTDGPSHDSQILSRALAKAMDRYENTVTDKMIESEYELLDASGETVVYPSKKPNKQRNQSNKEDDDFIIL